MKLLHWKPEYSVGIASVDHSHGEMIDLINEFYAKLDEHADVDAIEKILGDIYAAIAAHFALEERFMLDAKFGEYEAHKEDHENLLDEIRDLTDQFAGDPVAGRRLLQQRVGDWFEVHFSTFDARLHGQLGHDHL